MLPNSKLEHKLCMAVLAAAQTAALVGQKNLPQGIDSDIIYRDCIDAWEVALEIHWDIRCFSILENYHRYNDYQAVEEIRQMNYEKDLWIDACSSVEDSSWRDRIDGLDFRLDLAQWIIQLGGEPLSPRPFNHAAGTPQQPEGLLEGSLRLLKRILAAKENNTTFEWEKYLCN
jgi:hypothetical protein